jgi:hypothetical protein
VLHPLIKDTAEPKVDEVVLPENPMPAVKDFQTKDR